MFAELVLTLFRDHDSNSDDRVTPVEASPTSGKLLSSILLTVSMLIQSLDEQVLIF